MLLNNRAIDHAEVWVRRVYKTLCNGDNNEAKQLFQIELKAFIVTAKDYYFLAKICKVKLFNHLPLWYCIYMVKETSREGIKSTAWDECLIQLEKRIRREHHDPSLLLKDIKFY